MSHTTSQDSTLLFSLVLEARVRQYNTDAQASQALPESDGAPGSDPRNEIAERALQAIRNPYSLVHRQ
jgi:hypothetical protein